MIIIGVDPGQKGAVCLMHIERKQPVFVDIPNKPDRKGHSGIALDADKLRKELIYWLDGYANDDCTDEVIAYYEEQHVFGQSLNSKGIKTFFADYGATLAVLEVIGVPYVLVKPTTWQSGVGKPKGKEGSIWLAQKLYPKAELVKPKARTPSDGRADALLIADYGLRMEKAQVRGNR